MLEKIASMFKIDDHAKTHHENVPTHHSMVLEHERRKSRELRDRLLHERRFHF